MYLVRGRLGLLSRELQGRSKDMYSVKYISTHAYEKFMTPNA